MQVLHDFTDTLNKFDTSQSVDVFASSSIRDIFCLDFCLTRDEKPCSKHCCLQLQFSAPNFQTVISAGIGALRQMFNIWSG